MTGLRQTRLVTDERDPVALAEDMTSPITPVVVDARVHAAQPIHPATEAFSPDAEHEVVMRR